MQVSWKQCEVSSRLPLTFDMTFRPRSLLTRRLYSRRKYDDNELYRSNSFRFQRFERNLDEMDRRISKQVSLSCLQASMMDERIRSFIFIDRMFSEHLNTKKIYHIKSLSKGRPGVVSRPSIKQPQCCSGKLNGY